LPFKEKTFDVVYSCYLFHELPPELRLKIMQESIRVAKSNAIIGVVDSLQKTDDQDFEWALLPIQV
jgi:ubiquinone/menaquinone biosynthesis C-methylase UbiE